MDEVISTSDVAAARLAQLAKAGYRCAGTFPVLGSRKARKVFTQQHLETAPDAVIQEELTEESDEKKWSWYCGPRNPFSSEEIAEIQKILSSSEA